LTVRRPPDGIAPRGCFRQDAGVSPVEIVAILIAGVAAGAINAVVGSGTLITFPTLVTLGIPPLTANVSNNLGLVPGSLMAAIGYRRELAGQRDRIAKLLAFSTVGGLAGAIALLALPSSAFDAIVPVLLATAVLLVIFQSRIVARLAERRGEGNAQHPTTRGLVFATGVYGGYFGAAQGVLLLAILGIALRDSLQRVNALKNVLAAAVNSVAGLVFLFVADVDWTIVGLIAVGSTLGGWLGGTYGRRLPDKALRLLIVVVGLVAIVRLLA
jgi:uncharacterized membrane protein YfcA